MIRGYRLRLKTSSVLLIGGQHSSLALDKTTARYTEEDDPARKNQPYIPASALKGAMRIEFERLVRRQSAGREGHICQAPDPETMCQAPDFCPACRLFGNPKRPGKLRFYDARLTTPSFAGEAYQERTGVALSRVRRRAEPQKLFQFETTATGMELEFEARIECREALTEEEQRLFEGCLQWWSEEGLRVGGSRSRGLGQLRLSYEREEEPSPSAEPVSLRPTQAAGLRVEERQLCRVIFYPEERFRVSGIKPRGYLLPSLRFIPGSTLRGAIAQALRRAGVDDAQLQELFLRQPLALSHLYPEGFQLGKSGLRPATAWECKLDPRHGPYDLLIDQYLYRKALERGDVEESSLEQLRRRVEECSDCRAPLRRSASLPEVSAKLYAKLALNRIRMSAQPGMFYLYEAIGGPQLQFEGWMELTPSQQQAFSQVQEVLIGGARSKGFGRGGLEIDPSPPRRWGDVEEVQRRLNDFQERLQRRAQSHPQLLQGIEGRLFFTLDFLTDVVLPPGMSLMEMLGKVLRPLNGRWRVEFAVLQWVKVGGYNEATGRPKPLVSALGKGGVVLLSVEGSAEEVAGLLADLETRGIGLKRDEGFGWVQVCSPFHSEEVQR